MKLVFINGAIALLLSLHLCVLASALWPILLYVGPFAILLLVGQIARSANRTLSYAAIGGIIPIAVFHLYLLYDIWVRVPTEGGGANIGLGIVLLALPPISGLFMMAGRSVAAVRAGLKSGGRWWDAVLNA